MTLRRKYKILAKHSFGDALFQIAIGGGDDADIGLSRDVFAEPLVFALLQQAQQLGLNFHRQIADLIEKKRSAFGGLDLAPVILDRAGE